MRISWIHIKGFRNFDDEIIHFSDKTLIIGANDVGKTNMIYALRILFDKSFSEQDLELTDSDYNAYTNAESIEITVQMSDINESCLKSEFKDSIKDGQTYIQYRNSKSGTYSFSIGFSLDLLAEKSRSYIRRLNMEYVDTNRDLFKFLKREKSKLLYIAKTQLEEKKSEKDREKIENIQKKLNAINKSVNSLNYIKNSLVSVNSSLVQLSAHNEDQCVQFVACNSDVQKMLDNLDLSYSSDDNPLSVGGDGRNNQIFFATWVAKQNNQKSLDHVTFYAIEEPESHLHPHQQRKLSQYLVNIFDEQVFITSHSPQIACEFTPERIVRLFTRKKLSHAANEGCSYKFKKSFDDFGYRLNAISAETFFSDGIFLVEGPSEVLFYTALAKEIGIDLDYQNISILSVDGVGFKPYVKICESLEIPFVVRTDNDIFTKTVSKTNYQYYAGISRAIGIYKETHNDENDSLLDFWNTHKSENEWEKNESIPQEAKDLNTQIRSLLALHNIYLAGKSLEEDLVHSELQGSLKKYYGTKAEDKLIKMMQTRKAENMLHYLSTRPKKLKSLENSDIAQPLIRISKLAEKAVHPDAID